MPTEVRTVSDDTLIVVSSFANLPRNQGESISFTVFSNEDSSNLRLVPYGVIVVGGVLSFLPRSFPFIGFQRFTVNQGGHAGLVFNPSTFNGYFALLFQPFPNATGQDWTFVLGPD